jgi:hypothetical protein
VSHEPLKSSLQPLTTSILDMPLWSCDKNASALLAQGHSLR